MTRFWNILHSVTIFYAVFFALEMLPMTLLAALPQDIGTCDLSQANSGCLLIDENNENIQDGQLFLYYQWLDKPDTNKKTFIFLNGGPGGSSLDYLASKDFWKNSDLGQKYNVLFFDPRGVGRSSPVNQENAVRRKLQNYQINNLVDDIEELRQRLIPNEKIGIIGHSFGGHLVFSYATKYPRNILKLISLHGGASGLAFVTQAYFQNQEWLKAISGIDPEKLNQIKLKISAGHACSVPDIKPLPPTALDQLQLVAYAGSYAQRQQIPSLIKQSIQVNIDQQMSCPFSSDINLKAQEPISNLGLNVFINRNIVCNSLLTEGQISRAESIFQASARDKRNKQCLGVGSIASAINDFDLLEKLQTVDRPMLIVGAEEDQLVAPIVQKQIWDQLTPLQKSVSHFELLQKCGHNSFIECPAKLSETLKSFLSE
ncbi:MAG: alpha/beta hydrolase [Bdellovibrionaceae bacterium]|nr:alpha/beta hydrolase [Pseudobdellovibrionaceae bacterium]